MQKKRKHATNPETKKERRKKWHQTLAGSQTEARDPLSNACKEINSLREKPEIEITQQDLSDRAKARDPLKKACNDINSLRERTEITQQDLSDRFADVYGALFDCSTTHDNYNLMEDEPHESSTPAPSSIISSARQAPNRADSIIWLLNKYKTRKEDEDKLDDRLTLYIINQVIDKIITHILPINMICDGLMLSETEAEQRKILEDTLSTLQNLKSTAAAHHAEKLHAAQTAVDNLKRGYETRFKTPSTIVSIENFRGEFRHSSILNANKLFLLCLRFKEDLITDRTAYKSRDLFSLSWLFLTYTQERLSPKKNQSSATLNLTPELVDMLTLTIPFKLLQCLKQAIAPSHNSKQRVELSQELYEPAIYNDVAHLFYTLRHLHAMQHTSTTRDSEKLMEQSLATCGKMIAEGIYNNERLIDDLRKGTTKLNGTNWQHTRKRDRRHKIAIMKILRAYRLAETHSQKLQDFLCWPLHKHHKQAKRSPSAELLTVVRPFTAQLSLARETLQSYAAKYHATIVSALNKKLTRCPFSIEREQHGIDITLKMNLHSLARPIVIAIELHGSEHHSACDHKMDLKTDFSDRRKKAMLPIWYPNSSVFYMSLYGNDNFCHLFDQICNTAPNSAYRHSAYTLRETLFSIELIQCIIADGSTTDNRLIANELIKQLLGTITPQVYKNHISTLYREQKRSSYPWCFELKRRCDATFRDYEQQLSALKTKKVGEARSLEAGSFKSFVFTPPAFSQEQQGHEQGETGPAASKSELSCKSISARVPGTAMHSIKKLCSSGNARNSPAHNNMKSTPSI